MFELKYDPLVPPDPEEWLKLDESEKIFIIQKYHEDAGIEIEGMDMHAILHQIVENQLAQELPDVEEAMERLQFQGLDRHEAIHAISTVLLNFFWELIQEGKDLNGLDPNEAYFRELRKLTKKSWYREMRKQK